MDRDSLDALCQECLRISPRRFPNGPFTPQDAEFLRLKREENVRLYGTAYRVQMSPAPVSRLAASRP